jgi:hypothetical protein
LIGCGGIETREEKSDHTREIWHMAPVSRRNGKSSLGSEAVKATGQEKGTECRGGVSPEANSASQLSPESIGTSSICAEPTVDGGAGGLEEEDTAGVDTGAIENVTPFTVTMEGGPPAVEVEVI